MRIPRLLSLFTLILIFAAALAFGQGVATGDLHVTVKDPQGNLVTSATALIFLPSTVTSQRSGGEDGSQSQTS